MAVVRDGGRRRRTVLEFADVLAAGAALAVSAAVPAAAIIGGVDGSAERDPWMVFLADAQAAPDVSSHFTCGGTVVAPTKVVTAAPWVDEAVVRNLGVVGGRTDLRSDVGDVRQVVSTYEHEKVPPSPPPPPGTNTAPRRGHRSLDPRPADALPTLLLARPDEAEELSRAGTPARVLGWGITSGCSSTNRPPDR
ncbi:trypsin-like serine protease [Saccharopolyspora rhizosphaerae]|uniref:Trypsin-like serine protease n=1 Tax=Saccharopolyspora rhizosphaerae TaxID=2492662 RepID=A0A3R8VG46_9PSEU|nr:trypsin-like serine protease [Saccharopolyspora rhizosphaerae]RRO16880.1 trypsin-like serine protease [Saccharopolyspora rhizosphaerae]